MATEGARVKLPIALTNLAHYTAPLRRFGASSLGRLFVLAIGMAAMTAFTISDLQKSASFWLSACLWCCLAYFAVEAYVRAQAAFQAGKARSYLLSASGFVDLVAIFPVPIALAYGVAQPTAWLSELIMGSQAGAEFAGLRPACARVRARGKTARQRPGAVPDRAVPLLRRHACAGARRAARGIRLVAAGAVVGGGDADHDRIRRRGAAHPFGPPARRLRHDLRHRHLRIVDRYPGHRLRRRKPAAQFHPDLGSRQQGAVLPDARPVGDCRDHPYAAAARSAGQDRGDPPRPGRRLHVFHRRRRSRSRRQTDAGSAGNRSVLRRACAARQFGPQRQCGDDAAVDASDPRSRRFPHA